MKYPEIRHYRFCQSCNGYHWEALPREDICASHRWHLEALCNHPAVRAGAADIRLIPGNISPAFYMLYQSELARAEAARDGPQQEESAMPG